VEILRPHVPRYGLALIMGLGAFIATFDVTAVSLALPAIGHSFALSVADSVWVMNAYSLTFTTMMITAGAIADRYGYRQALVWGASMFLIASLLCALAPSFAVLIGGRILQGLGASFIVCGGYALMGRLYTEKAERVRAFAIMGTIGGSALAVGPGLGGIISSALGWPCVFLINLPICAAIIIGASARGLGGPDAARGRAGAAFDLSGVLAFSLFLLIASWALLYGPTFRGVSVGAPAVVLVLASLLALFVWIEARVANPAIELSLFRRRSFVGLALVPLCLAVSYWALVVYLPLFLQSAFHVELRSVAYLMSFFTLPMFLIPYLVPRVVARLRDSTFYAGGLLLVAAGCTLLAIAAYAGAYAVAVVGMLVAGVGAAAMQTQVSGALIASAPGARAGAVSAILTVLRQGGFALGTALLSSTMRISIGIGAAPGRGTIDGFTALFLTCAVVAGAGSLMTRALVLADENAHRTEGSTP
jgi:MFS family permease